MTTTYYIRTSDPARDVQVTLSWEGFATVSVAPAVDTTTASYGLVSPLTRRGLLAARAVAHAAGLRLVRPGRVAVQTFAATRD